MVISRQLSVIRKNKLVKNKQRCVCLRAFDLMTDYLLLITFFLTPGMAKDCGTHGTIYPIVEEDPIAVIQAKLKDMEERGEIAQHNRQLQKKTKASVERPKPVEGISKATESRVFYFDPTYVVIEDLKDHTGRVFAKKGSKLNPLETVSLSHVLLFFDGDDEDQKAWVKEQTQKGAVKLILVKGRPLSLAEEWKQPIYFDQGGTLTKKLGIQQVPAVVSQEKTTLRIEEIKLEKSEKDSKGPLKKKKWP
jgi:conjugal transfer pilus assembly protein TraW